VKVFEDIGVSGAAELDRRPGLLAALGALAEERAGLLIVHKRDRLARDPMIAGMITRLVERGGSTPPRASATATHPRTCSCAASSTFSLPTSGS
jgi:hypothetical protein